MTEQFNPSELYVWGPDGEYLKIPLSDEAENTEEQPLVVQWDSSGILRLDEGSATPGVAGPPKEGTHDLA